MSRKKRLLRVGCVTLALVAFVGYFTFSTFFFSPLEGRFKPDIAGLIPRTVDVYLARADLETAFSSFPDLAVADDLQKNPGVQAFLQSPEWAAFERENNIQETLENVRAEMAKLPLGLDVLDIAGGEDIALAANFAGKGIEDSEWAVYARASFYGKLAVSALRHPGLLGLKKQGMEATSADGVVTLSGGQLTEPLHVARVRDVIIAGSSLSLVQSAIQLESARSEDSLLLAAPYGDAILSRERATNQRDIEVQFDLRKMRETWGMTKPWLDPKSERTQVAFAARLLPLEAVRRVLGVVDLDQGIDIGLVGEFSTEKMTSSQERVYRAKGFDQDEVMNVAGFVAADATLFVYIRGPIATILQMLLDSLEPAARENLTSVVRRLQFDSIGDAVQQLDRGLVDRLAFVVRPNDWDYEGDMVPDPVTGEKRYAGPPRDGKDVFAWAAVGWMSDEQEIDDIKNRIARAGPEIGIHGATPLDSGFFYKPIGGGLRVTEFWSPFVEGTGHIAMLYYGENLILSNRYAMIDELVQNRVRRGSSAPLLANRPDFQLQLQGSLSSANVLVWSDPGSGTELIEKQARAGAELRIRNSIDFVSKRREVEREVLKTAYQGRTRSQLDADEVMRFDDLVDAQLRSFQDRVVEENLPRELGDAERMTTYLEQIRSALMLLRLSQKDFEISVKVVTPFGD